MKDKFSYRILVCSMILAFSAVFSGCGNLYQEEVSDKDVVKQKDMEIAFSVEDYQKKMRNNRILISEYREQYQKDIDEIQRVEYQNMKFSDCKFSEFPEAKSLKIMVARKHGITARESMDVIEKWLDDIGKLDEIDLKAEARIVTENIDESVEYPYCYESLYGCMPELDSGSGAFVETKDCDILLLDDGIYAMSDGKIAGYLNSWGYDTCAVHDAYGDNAENVVETGTLDQLGEKKYQLLSGELSVQEGAESVLAYFGSGTPFPYAEGVTAEISEVSVFQLEDVYGYDYTIRRFYHSVPIAEGRSGHSDEQNCSIMRDTKHAYVADDSGVSAFHGTNASEKLIPLLEENRMISLKDMAEDLAQNLAPHLNVEIWSAELAYAPISFDNWENSDKRVFIPCWQLEGMNLTKGENIWIYVDVFTGDIYYHTKLLEG